MDSSRNRSRPSSAATRRQQRDSVRRRSPSVVSSASHGSRTEESYDLEEFHVADGFRPTDESSQSEGSPRIPDQSARQPLSQVHTNNSSTNFPAPQQQKQSDTFATDTTPENGIRPRPSSISKSHRPHESLTLRNDGSSAGAANRDGPVQLSAASIAATGSAGPSHPYNDYVQGTSTEAAAGPTSNSQNARQGDYSGPSRPTHPYSLYPQSTEPLPDTTAEAIPVGFAGLGGGYQRQVGPDGESGDLIGPMGHLEELPPYTSQSPHGDEAADEGQNGLTVTRSVQSRGSREESDSTRSGSSDGPKDYEEQDPRSSMPKWKRRARTKVLGIIPCWAICLLVFALFVVGIIMGAVLGVLLAGRPDKKPNSQESQMKAKLSSSSDVEPLDSLPSYVQALTTGCFDLEPLDLRAAPRTCFQEPTQSRSWSCDVPQRYYTIDMAKDPAAPPVADYTMRLKLVNQTDRSYYWGTQPPNIISPANLQLVNDTFEQDRGPAWWFQMPYPKKVLVPGSSLSADSSSSSSSSKRSIAKRSDDDWDAWTSVMLSSTARSSSSEPGPEDGDVAWLCTWPNVTMEVFIYPNQDSSVSSSSSSTTTTTSSAAAAESTGSTSTDSTVQVPDNVPPYPKVVKMLERRLYADDDQVAAVCNQIRITDGGRNSENVLDDSGEPVTINIAEKKSSYEDLLKQQERSRHPTRNVVDEHEAGLYPRETVELTDCSCLWWSQ
ncbi:hypothetical protein GMORB2_7726 [Geosmithia morbida]|uniref:DUF7820 domain-containing protein n=1 Tax=Geosmithia morbida TaxID=1094350 RepID=A0A9P5CZY4_9HYPO|nr:uncharacterized protein GMORB2_7726 [Geosmithia morbida]KAF4122133.1 hypothetical protein GMORB2_7726 [Geosmithia morbida]